MPYTGTRTPPQIQRPASNTFILLSLLAALFLNWLPWEGIWLLLRPDFVAIVLLYWCMHKPWRIGIGISWAMGILADVSDASLFGQHALAYTILAFGGLALHRRLKMFDLRQQTIQVFAIFVLAYAVYMLVQWQVNGYMVWLYLLGSLTSTLLWAPLNLMFQAMQQKRVERDGRP
jgi:rod shape-determining protein MreD